MHIRKLSLLNFKNISQADIEMGSGINCFTGLNGTGKTNIIDALWYLSMCKSSLGMTDGQCVQHKTDFFMLNGQYEADSGGRDSVTCSFSRTAGKTIKRNSKEYEKLSDHIGIVPTVIVSPSDIFLVSDAADERRKWINSFISQNDRNYLGNLIRYNHALAERNKLLKQSETTLSCELLDILDMQLVAHGEPIHQMRTTIIEKLRPVTAEYYRIISGDREEVELTYRSELNETGFAELLTSSRGRDIASQFTNCGIHRDDMMMKIGGYPLKKYGSQGQQKSFLISLKLAQHTIIAESTGERPLLLLDDLFDKLDAGRLKALIDLVGDGRFGQIVISDCNHSRIVSILDGCGVDYKLFNVDDGVVCQER